MKRKGRHVESFLTLFIVILTAKVFCRLLVDKTVEVLGIPDNYVIGDVVELEDTDEPVIIMGYCQKDDVSDKVYDYVGVSYLDGYLDSTYNYLFDEDDILGNCTKIDYKLLQERKREIQDQSEVDCDRINDEIKDEW